jgi:hypothetical protein
MSTYKKRRRRAPGGGRKPGGRFAGNTERFNMRCTPSIKDRLEIAASKNNRSLPQEIQERLESTFDEDADTSRDPAMAGLLWMVENAARYFVRGGEKELPAWRTNPAEFEGFKTAISNILGRLRPTGEPAEISDEPNSPLNRARQIEWLIFDTEPLAAMPKQLLEYYRKGRRGELDNFPLSSPTASSHQAFMEREEARSAALRALGLK